MKAFDFDGVIADLMTPFCNIFFKKYGYKIRPEDIDDFYIEKRVPKEHEAWEILRFLLHRYEFVPPYKGAVETLAIYMKKEPLLIITQRMDPEPVYLWLKKHYLSPKRAKVICTYDKKKVIKELGVDFYIEDHPEICLSLSKEINLFCMDRPWNRYLDNLVKRVKSWDEIKELILR